MREKSCWKSAQIHFNWITRKNSSSSRRKTSENFAIQWQDVKIGGKIKINMAQKTCECQKHGICTQFVHKMIKTFTDYTKLFVVLIFFG